jgi:hypothetical protein
VPNPDWEKTIARMAGNIAGNFVDHPNDLDETFRALVSRASVQLARDIAAEVMRTAPKESQ